jgi:co-chaperonin GroES (HSP10)
MTTAVKPLRDLVYVEKIEPEVLASGIILPTKGAFMGHSARMKMNATPDYFHAKVIAIGPDVKELALGDEVYVHTFAEGDGSKLYTGENVGEKRRLLVKYPDDILCALDP